MHERCHILDRHSGVTLVVTQCFKNIVTQCFKNITIPYSATHGPTSRAPRSEPEVATTHMVGECSLSCCFGRTTPSAPQWAIPVVAAGK